MAQTFPEWTNKVPLIILVVLVTGVTAVFGFIWYYGSPKYTDVGYRPVQPVPYSHKLHATDLGIDCRYCHTSVEISPVSIIPPVQTCMNCHSLILPESEKLRPIRDSFTSGQPVEWIRVHNLPDYVYFNHSAHVNKGVGCFTCHGNINEMEVVTQREPLSMSWCLDCHRDPGPNLRPMSEITNMLWTPPADLEALSAQLIAELNINPSEDCSICHR